MSEPRGDLHGGHRSVAGGLARASVFGVSDGLVSNVSLILGFAGGTGGTAANVVRLAGIAGAVAGAASMAAGEWVSVSAQNELVERELAIERRELAINTEAETHELAAMYERHGMAPERAAAAARDVMSSPEAALAVHAREELGIDPRELPSAWKAAALSLLFFLVGALAPVVPWYVTTGTAAVLSSVVIGVLMAAVVGAIIGRFAERTMWWTSVRQVLILLLACGVTYAVGTLFGVTVT